MFGRLLAVTALEEDVSQTVSRLIDIDQVAFIIGMNVGDHSAHPNMRSMVFYDDPDNTVQTMVVLSVTPIEDIRKQIDKINNTPHNVEVVKLEILEEEEGRITQWRIYDSQLFFPKPVDHLSVEDMILFDGYKKQTITVTSIRFADGKEFLQQGFLLLGYSNIEEVVAALDQSEAAPAA